MAKKTKKKQKSKKTGPVRKSSPLAHAGVWVALVLVIVLGFVAYQKVYVPAQEKKKRIATEEKQFAEGQKAIDTLADKVASQFPPTSRESNNSCDYGSREFDLGPLSCTIEQNLVYKNVDVEAANKIMLGANNLKSGGQLKNISNDENGAMQFDNTYSNQADSFTSILNNSDISCSAYYFYPATDYGFSNDDLLVSYSCSSTATKEFYPVESKAY